MESMSEDLVDLLMEDDLSFFDKLSEGKGAVSLGDEDLPLDEILGGEDLSDQFFGVSESDGIGESGGGVSFASVTEEVDFCNQRCIMINGNGRDLQSFCDESLDCIITDAPHELSKSMKGGNRNFTDYECFRYSLEDFKEKFRVLKDGCFLVEFAPEESADNFEYLYELKKLAIAAGFLYYCKVPWKKGQFVANTGKKAKNTEDVLFFTKGKCRALRIDAKKMKADPEGEHFMAGTNGMLPTNFDVPPVPKKEVIVQSQKPLDLFREILNYVTKEGEIVLDQFAGSGVVGVACLLSGRSSYLIEKDPKTYAALVQFVKSNLGI